MSAIKKISKFYVLWFSKSESRWSMFSPKNFKHCSVIACTDKEWLVIDPAFHQLEIAIRRSSKNLLPGLIKTATQTGLTNIIGLHTIKDCPKKLIYLPFQAPFMCQTAAKLLTGVDIGWVFNPAHLYHKLKKFDGKKNYIIDYQWSIYNESSSR